MRVLRLGRLVFLVMTFLVVADTAAQVETGNRNAPLRLNMEDAVRIGVANDYALRVIRNRSASVRQLITERWLDYMPQFGVSYDRSRTINDAALDSIRHDIRFTIEQVIYDGGQRDLALDLARIDMLLNQHEFGIEYNRLRLNIQRSYLLVQSARGKILLNQKSLERARIQMNETRLEERLGFATRAEVFLVASRLREIELQLQVSRNEYRQALQDLKLVLNLDYSVELQVTGSIFLDYYLAPPHADLNALIMHARSERPEIKKALARVHQLRKEKEIAEDEWIPRVSVSGYVGRSGEEFPLRERNWGVSFRIDLPIGSTSSNTTGGLSSARDGQSRTGTTGTDIQFLDDIGHERRVLDSKLALGEGVADYQRLNNELAIEISSNYDRLQEQWETIRLGNGRVYFQYANLRIVGSQFEVGQVERAAIVESERDLVEAQNDLTDAIVGYIIAAYELEFSAALQSGKLGLIKYGPGEGNTLPGRMLRDDFKIPELIIEDDLSPEEIQEYLNKELNESESGEEEYLIDEFEIE